MLSFRKLFCTVALFLSFQILFAQGEIAILPAYNATHIQLKVMNGQKCLSNSEFMTKSDSEFSIQAFSQQGEELVVNSVAVDLVRKGRRLSSQEFGANIDLSSMMEMAEEEDVFRFQVNKIYLKDRKGKLQLYADGNVNFSYRYRETTSLGYTN